VTIFGIAPVMHFGPTLVKASIYKGFLHLGLVLDPYFLGVFLALFLDLLRDLLLDLLLADNFRGSRDQEFYDAAPRPPDLLCFLQFWIGFGPPIFNCFFGGEFCLFFGLLKKCICPILNR
jgi:hypothetical protein